jgi:hypothetical protein
MAWTGDPCTTSPGARFAAAQLAQSLETEVQNERATRVVAGRALDAVDCAEMLAMLGLDVPVPRLPEY